MEHSRIIYYNRARTNYLNKSLSRDTAALHVYKIHDRISISINGINTTRQRIYTKHMMSAEQKLSPMKEDEID